MPHSPCRASTDIVVSNRWKQGLVSGNKVAILKYCVIKHATNEFSSLSTGVAVDERRWNCSISLGCGRSTTEIGFRVQRLQS